MPKVPCVSWQSVHFISPSFTLWWNGWLKADFTSLWQLKQSCGWGALSRSGFCPGVAPEAAVHCNGSFMLASGFIALKKRVRDSDFFAALAAGAVGLAGIVTGARPWML